VGKELAKPFIIKCVDCKKDFDEKDLTYKRRCTPCRITKQTKERKRLRGDNKVTEWSINCKMCKKDFFSYSKQRMYCSNTCRTKFHNIPDDIKRTEDRIDRLVLKLEHFKSLIDQ
jgi:hypothetical protein